MNILFCGDSNIREGVLMSSLSLLVNQSYPLRIYIGTAEVRLPGRICKPVDDHFATMLDKHLASIRRGSSAVLINATDQFHELPPQANMNTRFTPLCMLRLYADRMRELNGLDRVLYLDNDVLCLRDFSDMYSMEMGLSSIAGVLDRYGRWFFHNEAKPFDYINSGVLLMEMENIRATGLLQHCRDLCAEKKMFMPDQSALNKLAIDKKLLPRRFNEQHQIRDDTALQHFSARFTTRGLMNIKPWQEELVHKRLRIYEYDNIFDRYRSLQKQFIK